MTLKSYEAEKANAKRKSSFGDLEAPSIKKFVTVSSSAAAPVKTEQVTAAIAKYLIYSMRPISEIENEGFIELLSTLAPTYQPPCRKVMRAKIFDQCQAVVSSVKKEVSIVMYCAGQADIWSSRRMHGYFGMALSYIQNEKLNTRVVACRRFMGSHTGERIAGMFNSLLTEFNVIGKVSALVTDNAANMVKAMAVSTNDKDENQDQAQVNENYEQVENESLVRFGVEWETVQDDVTFVMPMRYPCMAHTIQLVVNDGLKEATDRIKQVVGKCKKLVSSIHQSGKATEMLEREAECHIPNANATRWNSTYQMLNGVIKVDERKPGLLTKVAK